MTDYPTNKCFNLELLRQQKSKDDRTRVLESEFDRLSYIPLTPMFQEDHGLCTLVLAEMERREKEGYIRDGVRETIGPRSYRLRVLCDARGEKVSPGQTVTYKCDILTINPKTHKPFNTRQLRSLNKLGKSNNVYAKATVDSDGCITVSRPDATLLLFNFGAGVTTQRKISSDGSTYNHRYEEVPPWEVNADGRSRKERSA